MSTLFPESILNEHSFYNRPASLLSESAEAGAWKKEEYIWRNRPSGRPLSFLLPIH